MELKNSLNAQMSLNKEILNIDNLSNVSKVDSFVKGIEFKDVLVESQATNNQLILENLLKKIDDQEKALMKSPSLRNLNAYKTCVREFIKIASNNYKVSEMDVVSNMGYRKILNNSEVVDSEINKLIELYHKDSRNIMGAIDTMSNIKGLLLDMMV